MLPLPRMAENLLERVATVAVGVRCSHRYSSPVNGEGVEGARALDIACAPVVIPFGIRGGSGRTHRPSAIMLGCV
jgi:hypothetical protein